MNVTCQNWAQGEDQNASKARIYSKMKEVSTWQSIQPDMSNRMILRTVMGRSPRLLRISFPVDQSVAYALSAVSACSWNRAGNDLARSWSLLSRTKHTGQGHLPRRPRMSDIIHLWKMRYPTRQSDNQQCLQGLTVPHSQQKESKWLEIGSAQCCRDKHAHNPFLNAVRLPRVA